MILKEGRIFVLFFAGAALALLAAVAVWAAVPFAVLAVLFGYLYRNPDREIPAAPLGVVSPADGTVTFAGPSRDPFLDRDATGVTLRMAAFDAYPIRSPVEGKVVQRWHRAPGVDREGDDGELNYAVWIKTDEGDDVVLVMARHSSWRAPRCFVHAGERVGQGQRCGMIRFGSQVQIILPRGSRNRIEVGDRVRAGADLIGTLVRKPVPVAARIAVH